MMRGGNTELSTIDAIFAVGTGLFMVSGIPQILKLRRAKHGNSQSLLHNELHLMALSTMLLGYGIIVAPMSMSITIFELGLRLYMIKLIRKKRSYSLHGKSDLIHYIKKGEKKFVKFISRT
jgi:hypothetical protein